jgi:hypothetical protein
LAQDVDLIAAFTVYLALSTTASVVVRLRHNVAWTRFVLRVPGRWPHLYRELKTHRGLLLAWPTRVYVFAAALLVVLLLVLRFVVHPHARLAPEDLQGRLGWSLVLTALALSMVWMDGALLWGAAGFHPEVYTRDLDRAEKWLASWWRRIVARRRLRAKLTTLAVELNRWLAKRVVQFAVQLTLAVALWVAWATIR